MHFVSIIILTFNQLDYTIACIESIRRYTHNIPYEIIIVDNQSTDGTREWLNKQTDIKVIYNEENYGFPKGCNQGAEIAEGDSILFLNNDTIVTENWLSLLVDCLYSDHEIGAVGPVTNNCSNYQSIQVSYSNLQEMQFFAAQFNRKDSSKWEKRLKLVGYCFLVKKDILQHIGLFDEQFSPGNFEDDDLSLRIIQAGYHLIVCKDVFIHHFGSTSFKERPQSYLDLLVRNEQLFEKKWMFTPKISAEVRMDLMMFIDLPRYRKEPALKVLDMSPGCGGTLLHIKNLLPQCELYAMRSGKYVEEILSKYATIIQELEENTVKDNKFDLIVLGDIMSLVQNPLEYLQYAKRKAKHGAQIMLSVSNVMFYERFMLLLKGLPIYNLEEQYNYKLTQGIPFSELRLYNLEQLNVFIDQVSFSSKQYTGVEASVPADFDQYFQPLKVMMNENSIKQMKIEKYIGILRK